MCGGGWEGQNTHVSDSYKPMHASLSLGVILINTLIYFAFNKP